MSNEFSAMIRGVAQDEAIAFNRESPYAPGILAGFAAGIRRRRIARGAAMTVGGFAVVGLVAVGIGQPWHASPVATTPSPTATSNRSAIPIPSTTSSRAVTPLPGLHVAGAQLGPSGHALVTIDGVLWTTTDTGASWQKLEVPGTLASGHSVDINGATIVAATIDSGELVYQRSGDDGKTWTSQRLATLVDSTEADVAVSADGSTLALANQHAHSANFSGSMVLYVGPVGHDLVARDAPLDGTPVWVGTHLVISGGPLASDLIRSDDEGKTWTQSTVAGVKAPMSSQVASGTPSIGTAVASATGAIVPVTIHRGSSPSLSLLATTDGRTFNSVGEIPLSGDVAAGVTAIGSTAGPDAYVFADPTSTDLFWVNGSNVTTVPTTGLPGAPESITFSDTSDGLASVPSPSSGELLFRTSDAGRTWVAVARPSA